MLILWYSYGYIGNNKGVSQKVPNNYSTMEPIWRFFFYGDETHIGKRVKDEENKIEIIYYR